MAATATAAAATTLEAATATLEAPTACRSHFSAPTRGAARARVTHITTLPKSLERL